MSVNWQNSKFVKRQRYLLEIRKKIKEFKRLEDEKNELTLKFPQQEITGRIESLNKRIDIVNDRIGKLKEERSKIEIKVP